MADPRKTPPLVLPNFPYKGRFSREQLAEAMDRKDRIVETLLDPVGPDGTLINLPLDMLHILAFHQALAGVDVHTDHRQLIESRTVRDDSQMFELCEWRPKGDFGDTPLTQDDPETGGEAAGIAAQMRTQLTPEVRRAVAAILADEFANATAATAITDAERAHNVLLEQRTMKEAQP